MTCEYSLDDDGGLRYNRDMEDFRKSTYSVNNGQCAEVGNTGVLIVVRDTSDRDGVTLAFPIHAWESFTSSLK